MHETKRFASRRLIGLVVTAIAATACADGVASTLPTHTEAVVAQSAEVHQEKASANDLKWGPLPPGFPPGAKLAVVQGDPSEVGAVFTVRLRMPNAYVIPPHYHPEDEHVTVIAGRFDVGLGNVVEESKQVASLQREGFITAPKLHSHWGIARGQTVVQIHGIGPFQTTFVDEHGNTIPN